MKKLLSIAQFVWVFLLLTSFQAYSQIEQKRQVSSFEGIDVGSAIELFIKQGNEQSVVVKTDDDLQDKVTTEVNNNILTLRMDVKNQEDWRNKKVIITVTTPELGSLRTGGASRVNSDATFKSADFDLHLEGASKVKLSLNAEQLEAELNGASILDLSLTAKTIKMQLSGASKTNITGNTDEQELNLSGASHYEAFKLDSKRAIVDASSASKANISVSEQLSANLSSASHLNYKGNAKANQLKSSGAASIRKAGE